MRIEEVSIDGFKSYSKRVVVSQFDRSFNAITGLNGSGKSNILDALCFVLGIKNLNAVRSCCSALVHSTGLASGFHQLQRRSSRGPSNLRCERLCTTLTFCLLDERMLWEHSSGVAACPRGTCTQRTAAFHEELIRTGLCGVQYGDASVIWSTHDIRWWPVVCSLRRRIAVHCFGQTNIIAAENACSCMQVRAGSMLELVYKQGQAGVTKATVSVTFRNDDELNKPPGYETVDKIVVTRQVVVGGRDKYMINGTNAQPGCVGSMLLRAACSTHGVKCLVLPVAHKITVNVPHLSTSSGTRVASIMIRLAEAQLCKQCSADVQASA
jgi:RecF/RecN/SMC N terminal domain